ncbi:hypothetical protein F5Y16DRAFT_422297 [Xylariaceae sp. FL0255]|nr:hypothetical protein F5Y16DRAFT_422297 [Xylariaceae sp. FL0255]
MTNNCRLALLGQVVSVLAVAQNGRLRRAVDCTYTAVASNGDYCDSLAAAWEDSEEQFVFLNPRATYADPVPGKRTAHFYNHQNPFDHDEGSDNDNDNEENDHDNQDCGNKPLGRLQGLRWCSRGHVSAGAANARNNLHLQ